jgi:hypothetical protein
MTNKIPQEIEDTITYEGDLILTEDFKTEKNLIVKGNIFSKDGLRYNIDAGDINARDINALDINAWDINARDINALDINALDINARDINALDIDALNINAWNIICEKRIKKNETAKTRARIFIENKSQLERKEW